MKITFLNTFESFGGAAIAGKRLALALHKNNIAINNLVLYPGSNPESITVSIANKWLVKKLAWLKLALEKAYFYFQEKSPAIRFQFSTNRYGFKITRHKSIKKADIIHLHWFHQGFMSLKEFKKLVKAGKPIVWTLHDMWAFTGGCHYAGKCTNYTEFCGKCPFLINPDETDLSHQIHLRKDEIYKFSNMTIVTCSQWLAQKAKESTLLGDCNIKSIPNPIDTDYFKPLSRDKVRHELGLPVKKKILLFGAAKLDDKRKGFKYLIHALKMFGSSDSDLIHDNILLLTFGSNAQSLAKMLPFEMVSLGKLETPSIAYNAADIFVLPSLEDNLPNTIMEAMACGTPCIGFETGGIPEMIDHEINGYVARYKSDENLLDGIKWLLYEADYKALSKNARQKVLENYAEDIIARKYIDLYKNILHSGK